MVNNALIKALFLMGRYQPWGVSPHPRCSGWLVGLAINDPSPHPKTGLDFNPIALGGGRRRRTVGFGFVPAGPITNRKWLKGHLETKTGKKTGRKGEITG